MKRILYFLACLPLFAHAQAPEASVELDELTLPTDIATALETELGAPARTFRLYAVIPSDYELQIVYGDFTGALEVNSTTSFYQNPLGGPAAEFIDPDIVAVEPTLGYDTWLTIGDDDAEGNMSIMFPSEAAFATWEAGGNLVINDLVGAGILIGTFGMNPQSMGDENGRVLLGQFTTTGDVMGQVNFQLRRLNPDGSIYDPPGDEVSETYVFLEQPFSSIPVPAGCVTDLNGDDKTDVSDILIVLGDYGCGEFPCIGDVNISGNTDVADILVVLGEYGNTCE